MAERNKGNNAFGDKMRSNLGPEMRVRFEAALQAATINEYQIIQGDDTT